MWTMKLSDRTLKVLMPKEKDKSFWISKNDGWTVHFALSSNLLQFCSEYQAWSSIKRPDLRLYLPVPQI
jgi:hypothetical protein